MAVARGTVIKSIRLTPAENGKLQEVAEGAGLTVHGLLVKMVREVIGARPDLLNDDVGPLADAAGQALAIGRNLNQLVRSVNSGKAKGVTVDAGYLDTVAGSVETIVKEIHALAERQRRRWVAVGGP
jgi:hypothetical protein